MVGRCRVRWFGVRIGDAGSESSLEGTGGTAVTVRFSVTVTRVDEDGNRSPVDGELATALAGPVEQFSTMLTWTAEQAASLDHGQREQTLEESGRELQRRLLQATFAIDCAREERVGEVTSAAGIRHGTVEKGHERGVVSIFGPVRAARLAYKNRREANLYPADARWRLPDDVYSLGMRALVAFHLATGGYGQTQEIIQARTGVTVGRAQLAGLAADLASLAEDFYARRAVDTPDARVRLFEMWVIAGYFGQAVRLRLGMLSGW